MADKLPYPLPDKVSHDVTDFSKPIPYDDKTLLRSPSEEAQMQKRASRVLEDDRRREGLGDSSLEAPVDNGSSPFKGLRSGR